jgi:hypothetical protein
MDKHSSLLRKSVNYDRKKFYSTDPRGQCFKSFYSGNSRPFNCITVILSFKAILPWKLQWNGSKLPWFFKP